MVASVTLVQIAYIQDAVFRMTADGTDEALWPAPPLFSTILTEKTCQTQTLLKLDRILFHRLAPRVFACRFYAEPRGSKDEPLESCDSLIIRMIFVATNTMPSK